MSTTAATIVEQLGADGKPVQTAPTVEELQRQVGEFKAKAESEAARAKELEESAQYWHEKATTPAEKKEAAAAAVADKTDLLEVAAKGPDAMKAWLKEQGFVTATEAAAMTDAKAAQIVQTQGIINDYPEVNDPDSDFYKAADPEYQALIASGYKAVDAMRIACERVELQQLRAGKPRAKEVTHPRDVSTAPNGSDEERTSRARAQQGDRGRKAAGDATPTVNDLTPEQRRIADGMGISHENYLKRALEGTTLWSRN